MCDLFFCIKYLLSSYILVGDIVLKKMSIRKIIMATFTLMVLLILCLIDKNDKEIELDTSNIEYIYSNMLDSIYLLDKNDYVALTSITTCDCDIIDKSKDLLNGLIIDGAKSAIIPNGFRSIIPTGTSILDVKLDNKVLTVNFSKELLDISSEYEEAMIESIVYTLTSIEGIDKVNIQVEGKELTKLPHSKKNIPTSLDKSYGINKVYDINNTKDIDSITLYYVNSYNDNKYYVPVTKYINNDSQDKIKVIIEQLSNSLTYESNLMSYLSDNAKLLDYEIDDKTIKLNFNNMILSDISSNNILEEVVYTIGYSINEVVDVDEVVFYVNNEKICNFLLK